MIEFPCKYCIVGIWKVSCLKDYSIIVCLHKFYGYNLKFNVYNLCSLIEFKVHLIIVFYNGFLQIFKVVCVLIHFRVNVYVPRA